MAQIDPLAGYQRASTSMGQRHYLIVPSDGAPLPVRPSVIYCREPGVLVVVDEDGVELTYPMKAGELLVFRPVQVKATGTTGTYYGWF